MSLFIFSFSLFQALLTVPVTTTINLFFLLFFSVTSPIMHLVECRGTTWRDEDSVQHTEPKIVEHSHYSPAHLLSLSPSRLWLGVEPRHSFFMFSARMVIRWEPEPEPEPPTETKRAGLFVWM